MNAIKLVIFSIIILTSIVWLFFSLKKWSCGSNTDKKQINVYETKTNQSSEISKAGEVITSYGDYKNYTELKEFNFKGHTYISCDVHGGMAITHAGHCWCNQNK